MIYCCDVRLTFRIELRYRRPLLAHQRGSEGRRLKHVPTVVPVNYNRPQSAQNPELGGELWFHGPLEPNFMPCPHNRSCQTPM